MSLLALSNIGHRFGSHAVLNGVTLSIEAGEKVGLVGRNGSGKTTLMKVMLGQLVPDSGTMQVQRAARVGYLSQDPTFDPQETVRDAAEGAFAELHRLHGELHGLFEQMAGASGEALERLLRRQSELETAVQAAGGYALDHRIDAMLHGLGFEDAQFTLKVSQLSGGQKNRLGLAKLLLQEPDILLLDEPTNHLDIAGRQWLEQFLADEFPGAVVLVSHDRWLLDRVVDRIIEIERGSTYSYPGGYAEFVAIRSQRQLTESRAFEKQQDKIKSEEEFIRRYKAGQRAKQARGRETRLDRLKRDEMIDRPAVMDVMRLQLPPAPRSGEQIIVAQDIAKRYGDLTLFDQFSLHVTRGERIGIIGPNGTGKTTLARCLLGELAVDEGTIRLGSRLRVGHYRQSHEHLDQSLPVWQYLQSVIVPLGSAGVVGRASEQQARDLAGAFLFSGLEQDKPLGSLSGGERSRAVLAGLVAGANNVLVLDEPTNHLDIPSSERLEAALSNPGEESGGVGYEGTLLLISHDRALLEATCDRLIVFDGHGGVREFTGTVSEWEAQGRTKSPGAASSSPRASQTKPAAKAKEAAKPRASSGQGAVKTAADKKVAAMAKMTLPQIEQAIERVQKELSAIDQQMADPAVYRDGAAVRRLQTQRETLTAELEPLEFEWSCRAEEA